VFRGRRPLQKVADVAIHNSFISELTDKQIVKHSEDNYDQSFYTIETLDKTIYLNYDSKYNLQDRGGYQVVSSESIPSFYLFNNFDKWIEEDEHGNQIYTHNNAALNYFNLFHSN
jgi:hypothetical protein